MRHRPRQACPVTTEGRAKRLMPVPLKPGPNTVFDAACRHHTPVLQHHDARGKPRDLIDGMRHIHDRDAQLVAQRFDERQDLELALGVERSERLVHQQDLRRGEEGAADGHPLLFPAREPRRLALEQMLDAERLDHPVEGNLPRGLRREPAAEQQISACTLRCGKSWASWNTSPTLRR